MHEIGLNEKTSISVILTYLLAAVVGAIVGGVVVYTLIKGSKQKTVQPVERRATASLPDDSKYIE